MLKRNNTKSKKSLHIIIVGCGKVGQVLTERLTKEGHDITVIDKKAERISQISNMYDIMAVEGNGASYSTQKEAGVDTADLLIAVTESDELNILCCVIAKRMGDTPAIARVRTPDYSKEIGYLQEKLGLAMIINPEQEAATEIARILALPSALEVNSFAHGQAEMIELTIPKGGALDGMTIAQLGQQLSIGVVVCAIRRGEEVIIPSGLTILRAGDNIILVGQNHFARIFLKDIGVESGKVKDCIIVGGGKGAYYLADRLIKDGIKVKLIERNHERCEELSKLLPKAIVICGDGSDENLLKEEGIESCESFVPLTGIDEENAFLTMYAKQVSSAKVITKVNRINFSNVIHSLDLGSIIYPKYLAAEAIIAYVRARSASVGEANIETMYHLFDQRVEAIEFKVTEKSPVVGTKLKDLRLKENVLLACINRNGKIIIPGGSDAIDLGDTVMIVTTQTGFSHIDDILR